MSERQRERERAEEREMVHILFPNAPAAEPGMQAQCFTKEPESQVLQPLSAAFQGTSMENYLGSKVART